MKKIDLDEYRRNIQIERNRAFEQPYELVYKNFIKLKYDEQTEEYFKQNASNMIETLRRSCWDEFTPIEKKFYHRYVKNIDR